MKVARRTFLKGSTLATAGVLLNTEKLLEAKEPKYPHVWAVDSLIKVDRKQSPPVDAGKVVLDAARGEVVSGQIVVTAGERALRGLSVTLQPAANNKIGLPALAGCEVRYGGYVFIKENSRSRPPEEILYKAPCDVADVLLENPPDRVPPGWNQPVFVMVRVAPDAPAGLWSGRLIVTDSGGFRVEIALELHIYGVLLPTKRTVMAMGSLRKSGSRLERRFGVKTFSDGYWELMETFAAERGKCRQNGITIPPLGLVNKSVHDGKLVFDFSRFDRFVETFIKHGACDEMHFNSLATRDEKRYAHFSAPYLVGPICEVKGGKLVFGEVRPEHPRFERFLSRWLPALEKHLKEKGWLEIASQHLCSEAGKEHAGQYRKLADLCRKYAPKLRRVDAYFAWRPPNGEVNYWLPHTDYYASHRKFFRERMEAGDRVGLYADGSPGGSAGKEVGIYSDDRRIGGAVFAHYLDESLMKIRVIFWYCFAEGLRGYTYWAWNAWRDDPYYFARTANVIAPGSGCLVYPKPRPALGIDSSIRVQHLLESIQDCELLKILQQRDPLRAKTIAGKTVRSAHEYVRDPKTFRALRRQLLESLS